MAMTMLLLLMTMLMTMMIMMMMTMLTIRRAGYLERHQMEDQLKKEQAAKVERVRYLRWMMMMMLTLT